MNKLMAVVCLSCAVMASRRDDFKPDLSGITIKDTHKANPDKAKEVLEVIKAHREAAAKTIYETLGIKKPIYATLVIADATTTIKGAVAVTEGYGKSVIMTFGVEAVIRQQWSKTDLEQTLAHELVHAYFRNHMNSSTYNKYHKWIQEGIAIYGANQIEYRAKRLLKRKGKSIDRLANGLENDNHSADDFAEDGLAFAYIKQKAGDDKVKQFVEEMIKGKDYRQILKGLTGEDFPTFLNHAKAHATEYLKKIN